MQLTTPLLVLAAAGLAAAQDSDCAAASIVEACLEGYQDRLEGCTGQDYDCLCAVYTDIRTCWNNCPNDPRAAPAGQQVLQFCNAASQFGSAATRTATASTGTATGVPATTTSETSTTSTAPTGSAFGNPTTTSTGGAAYTSPAAGVLAAIIGAAVML